MAPPRRPSKVQLANLVLIKGGGGRQQYEFPRITLTPDAAPHAETKGLHHNSTPLRRDCKIHLQKPAAVSGAQMQTTGVLTQPTEEGKMLEDSPACRIT